ncbi:MAG: hypothetical protein QM714_03730 [Nocardioides sp.]|uniref:FtsX-like permease family protein n=1 Tax=Nocardioides sp. TaxID=35761 RepID=UPI0039E3B59C
MRDVAVFLVCALGVTTVLTLLAAQAVVGAQQLAEDLRTPRPPDVPSRSSSHLLSAEFVNNWSGRKVTRVVISSPQSDLDNHPPGISRNPLPGEVFISPEVAALRDGSPALEAALAGAKVVGEISPAGLIDPHELRIIQGTTARSAKNSTMAVIEGWSTHARPRVDLSGPLLFFVPLMVSLCLLPLVLALLLGSRLTAPETDRRAALLKALGLRRRQVRMVSLGELLPSSAAGVIAGWLFFAWASRHLTRVPGTGLAFWPADAALPPLTQVLVPLVILVLTLTLGTSTVISRRFKSVRPVARHSAPRWWWVVPSALGMIGVVAASTFDIRRTPEATSYMIVAAAILLLGLPWALRYLTAAVGEHMARVARSGTTLLAGRWATKHHGATSRLAIAVAAGIFAVAAAAPFVTILSGPIGDAQVNLKEARGYNLAVSNTTLTRSQISSLPEVRLVLEVVAVGRPRDGATALRATCADLDAIVRLRSACTSKPSWIQVYDGSIKGFLPDLRYPAEVPALSMSISEAPTRTVRARLDPEFQAAILLDRPGQDVAAGQADFLVNLPDGSRSLEVFEGHLAHCVSPAEYHNAYSDWIAQAHSFSGYLAFLRVGGFVGLLGLSVALLSALTRSAIERRQVTDLLRTIGLTRKARIRTHIASQFIPLCVSMEAAALAGVAVWIAAAHLYARAAMSVGAYLVLLTVPIAIAILLTVLTLPAALAAASAQRDSSGSMATATKRRAR